MDEEWDLEEGVLRGRRKPDGSWEFVQVIVFDDGNGPEKFPLQAATPAEARRIASKTEKRELVRYSDDRRLHHARTSFNESGWVGDILEKPPAKFLIDEFELHVGSLSQRQLKQLERDVLSVDHSFLTEAKQRAKADLKATRQAIKQLSKQKARVEGLSRGFRAMAHFSRIAAPDVTLAQLLFELSENEKAIGENLDEMGHDKSNISSVSLCGNAIDIFLRWYDDDMPLGARGIQYSARWRDLARLPKVEGKPEDEVAAGFDSPLGVFLEEMQHVLSNHGLRHWKFGIHEPARKALGQFQRRPEILV